MKCKKCNKELEEGMRFCPNCGASQEEVQIEVSKEENPIAEPIKEQSDEYKAKEKKHVFSWIVCLIMGISTIATTPYSIANVFFLICTLLACPPFVKVFNQKTSNKISRGLRIFIFIIALLAAGMTMPSVDKQTKPVKQTENIISNTKADMSSTSIFTNNDKEEEKKEVKVIDFSAMQKKEIQKWCDKNKINLNINEEYSTKIKKGKFISQSVKAGKTIYQEDSIEVVYSLGKKPTTEEKNALKKAETYSEVMHMSKKGIYRQLISEYGEGFSKEAAQYAIDNINANWKANALEKAKTYRDTMSMSKNAIYKQLISEYGEQFTKTEAKYAIDHLDD